MALIACHGKDRPGGTAANPAAQQPPEQVAQPEFPEGTRSLDVLRMAAVRLEPAEDAKRIGTIFGRYAGRVDPDRRGQGLQQALGRIPPRGWVCGDYLAASKKRPYGQKVPHLDRGEIVPGVYGKVTAPNTIGTRSRSPRRRRRTARSRSRHRASSMRMRSRS